MTPAVRTTNKVLKTGVSHRYASKFKKEELLAHHPTTAIIETIAEAGKEQKILTNVKITKAVAEDLLTLNTDNRPIRLNTVDLYEEAMKSNRWEFVGDVIRVTESMKLIDGQQRLLAITRSGKTQVMHIQTGLSEKAFGVIDSGRTRTGGDVLAVSGFLNFNVIAAAIKALIYFKEFNRVGAAIHATRIRNEQIVEWTRTENVKLLQKCHDYIYTDVAPRAKFLSTSTWVFIYYLFSTISIQDATEFITLLATGQNLSMTRNSAIYLLRERLLNFKSDKNTTGKKFMDIRVRYIITAWNFYRQRKKIVKLSIDTKSTKIDQPI